MHHVALFGPLPVNIRQRHLFLVYIDTVEEDDFPFVVEKAVAEARAIFQGKLVQGSPYGLSLHLHFAVVRHGLQSRVEPDLKPWEGLAPT